MDLNWNDHPMGPQVPDPAAGWQWSAIVGGPEEPRVRELLAYYTYQGVQMIWWGNDWDSPHDSMHFQMGYNTYQNPLTQEFADKFINADGTSKFKASKQGQTLDAATVLAAATGLGAGKAAEILPTLSEGLALAQCTTVNRIAMFIAQTQEESDNYNTTEEYGDGPTGDAYKGRTWIQITWQSNYAAFGQWAAAQGLISDPNQFVDDPTSLADMQWAGVGAAWYWTVQRPQINQLCDEGDINGVTEAINGGYNGLDVRTANWNRALAQGDALLTLTTTGEDDMFTDDDRNLLQQIADIRRPSLSPLRHLGEGDVNTCAGFAWSADGNIHVVLVERLAVTYGDPTATALLMEVAGAADDPAKWPDRQFDAKLAKAILSKVADAAVTAAKAQIQEWLDAEHAQTTAAS